MIVRKRDGVTTQAFDVEKVRRAVLAAFAECKMEGADAVERVVQDVVASLPIGSNEALDIEMIQNVVEISLMRQKEFAVAKAYILYREKRAEARAIRGKKPDQRALSDYIIASKYARHSAEKERREIYPEIVDRSEAMHIRRFPHLADRIRWAYGFVREQKVVPSMRAMQFAGLAIESNHCRSFNCSFSHIDRFEAFSEAMWLLLSGCGVGYSVQYDHNDKLPPIGTINPKKIRHHVVEDTIEGWADAVKALFQSFTDGVWIEFAYHLIRDAGSPLRTSGGRAPGHTELKKSLERVRQVLLGAQGRRLRPIESHRIMCMIADAPLSGGVRRSAMIALFSPDDSEMRDCKTGNWFEKDREPYFANANNSAVFRRDDADKKMFMRVFSMTKQWGDPGFYFTWNIDYGTNPCSEIGLHPVLTVDVKIQSMLARKDVQASVGDRLSGWAFCNLSEINAAKLTSVDDFLKAADAATFIGTLQASYTSMPYLGPISETIAERDALLGVSMTGMLDAPQVACSPHYQRLVACHVVEQNREYARLIGIEPAARTTCVKPSGTASLALGGVAAGHHAHHARRYIRRVIADEHEFVFQEFKKINPHMCVRKPDGKWVIEFPVEAPVGAMIKSDLNAISFLKMVQSTQKNWVSFGTADETYSPGLSHNVSNTIHVEPDEWGPVGEYLWENRAHFTGVALLQTTGDKDFAFAPLEAVVTEADETRWNQLLAGYKPVDYSAMREEIDGTDLKAEPACAGGACAIET